MDSFDLGRLNDHDFEMLCKDLFEDLLGIPLEVFSRGRDQGIDLRHVARDGTLTVVQCKHRPRSTRARLVAHMCRDERPKVLRVNPDRYLIATSVELTAAAKEKIVRGLAPQVVHPGDIHGREQLVEELRKRPELVKRHFRLWLSSTAVLEGVLRKESLMRTSDLLADMAECARVFVPTPAFEQARRLLARQCVCIVAGHPGIGKTAIARMLAVVHCAEGYDLVEVSRDVDEINAAWRDDVDQLFYYDDFLGRTVLGDKFGKNEDGRLLRVIARIRNTSGKRLVLTTRDYLLKQAETEYGRLDEADLSPLTLSVLPGHYSTGTRARILYNLVYFSGIPEAEKRRVADPYLWRAIVHHENFDPRLLERTLGLAGFAGVPSAKVADEILANFAQSDRLWARVIEVEMDAAAVHILEVLFTFGSFHGATGAELLNAWTRYRRELGAPCDMRTFRNALRVIDGTLIALKHTNPFDDELNYVFHNPAIEDYFNARHLRGEVLSEPLLRSAGSTQIRTLMHLARKDCGLHPNEIERHLRGLVAHREVVVDAILHALRTEPPCDYPHWAERYAEVLSFATSLRSQRLVDHVVDELSARDWTNVVDDAGFPAFVQLVDDIDASDLFPIELGRRITAAVVRRSTTMVEVITPDTDTRRAEMAAKFLAEHHQSALPADFGDIMAAIREAEMRAAWDRPYAGSDWPPLDDDVSQAPRREPDDDRATIEELRRRLAELHSG